MKKVKVFCNGESLYINGEYVVDCCESLDYTFSCIARALNIPYEYVEDCPDEDEEMEE